MHIEENTDLLPLFLSNHLDTRGFFISSHISMFMNRIGNVALWENVYAHETIHSILNDTLNGWHIQLFEEISDNMFVCFRRGDILRKDIVSWILNLQYKKIKLCESWMQIQEGFATFVQLHLVDIERRAISCATELWKLQRKTISEEDVDNIKRDVTEIREKMIKRLSSKNCPEHYWKGYDLVNKIAEKFGQENLMSTVLAACSVRFPSSLISMDIESFQKLISSEIFNVDKRLGLISEIPEYIIKDFPLNNELWNLTQSILQYLGEEPLPLEFDLLKTGENFYLDPRFPKEFIDISKIEFHRQVKESEDRWEMLKRKGIDSSQLVSLFNIAGEPAIISDFEFVHTRETEELSARIYRSILNTIDKNEFIQDLLAHLETGVIEKWMEELRILGDPATSLKNIFPLSKLLSTGEACSLCHSGLKYSNFGVTCPHSNLKICMQCCNEMACNCIEFNNEKIILSKIEEVVQSFSYKL